jgi:glutathione peroxidase
MKTVLPWIGLMSTAALLTGLAHQPPAEQGKPSEREPEKQPVSEPRHAEPERAVDAYVLGFTIPDIDGKEQDLAQWKGKVVMIVNTASHCGYTRQYKNLESLYQRFKDRGFVVLAFPSRDFADQEFEDNAAIKNFCTGPESKYKITFPLFARISVRGEKAHPLFAKLRAQPAPIGGEPKWNFTKWLVDRRGNVVARYDTRVDPDSDEVKKRIEELLDENAADPAGKTPEGSAAGPRGG